MKNKNFIQILKFTLFSISAGVIQAVVFALLTEVPPLIADITFGYWVCYLPSLLLSVVWNFTFNRRFTFHSAANIPVAMLKVLGYYAVFTPLSTVLGDMATEYFSIADGSAGSYIVLAVTMIINFVTEFLFDKYVVFTDAK